MDHKKFVNSLPADVKSRLYRRQNARGFIHLVGHLLLILATGTLIALRVPFWPVFLPVHGIFLVFLFTLEHEATHKTPFASTRLNEWVGFVAGLVILLPFTWFRYFHLAHHKFTNIPDKDPELLAGGKPEDWRSYVVYASGLPYLASMIRQIMRNAFGLSAEDYVPVASRTRIKVEARRMLTIYGLAAVSLLVSPLLIWVWLVPVLLGQPFLRIYLLAEHGRCALVANMFQNTRTTFTNKAVRFLTWNMPFHTEHHVLPNVPFHALPELHQIMQEHLRETEPGYVRFTQKYIAEIVR